jgi:tetratricopeptide (TPR) repeat protein
MAAALLVLVGGLLAFAASGASDNEQSYSSRAQAASITASAGYGEAYSEIARVASSDAEARTLQLRAEAARAAGALTGSAAYDRDAESWDQSAQALGDLLAPDVEGSHFDDVNQVTSDLLVGPRVNALRADAQRETAAAWGTKADRYVLGITLLAVALSLLGLSLTVTEGTRRLLVFPAALIAAFAAVISVLAAASEPVVTPDDAVEALAEGDRLMTIGRYDAALQAYSEAIRIHPDYAQAYRARSTADLLAGSPSVGAYVVNTVDEKSRANAIADLDRTLELSAVPDYLTLVNRGANLFHERRYAESEEMTRRALATNDRLPLPWSNLALVQAAQGQEKRAMASYNEMIRRTSSRPDPRERAEIYAASRSQLEILVTQKSSADDMVEKLEGLLVAAQAAELSPGANPAGEDASISKLALTAQGHDLTATYRASGLPAQSRITWVGYFRPQADDPWEQRWNLVHALRVQDASAGRYHMADIGGCPGRGQYRLEAWLDDRLLASATADVAGVFDGYVGYYDAASRVTACRPVDWQLDDSAPGVVRLSAPGAGGERLMIRTVPVPAELIDTPSPEVAETALDTENACNQTGPPLGQAAVDVGGIGGVGRLLTGRADGSTTWCWAGVGKDRLLRLLVADYRITEAGSPEAIIDLIPRLHYNDTVP